jgi:molybdopterin-containing oxidoreductase family iron-sulfur binding subunit
MSQDAVEDRELSRQVNHAMDDKVSPTQTKEVQEPLNSANEADSKSARPGSFIPLSALSLNSRPPKRLSLADVQNRLAHRKGKEYWRSLDELADTQEFRDFVTREFPRQAPASWDGLNRRDFLKLMGAGLALAGLSGCALQPAEKIVPYVNAPEDVVNGLPLYFASVYPLGGYARGVLVESHMGRPTKIEGNPDHPAILGATDSIKLASILDHYDP